MIKFKLRKKIRKKRLQTRQDRIMTLANAISISRILMSVPLVSFLDSIAQNPEPYKYYWVFGIVLYIAFSDFLDGYVARKADEITNFGKLIDPVADKICMMVVLLYLIFTLKTPFLIFFILLSLRDIFLIVIGVYLINSQDEVFQSNWTGKWFVGISAAMMAVFVFEFPPFIQWSLYTVSTVLMVISTFQYVKYYLSYFKKLEN
jgi:CDP-diacylglycerol--glycerol-3-phosphate 3-phosphatidyltransferase